MLKINFVGDINPGGVLTFMGGVSQEIKDVLADADIRIGTLESAIGSVEEFELSPKKMNDGSGHIIYSPNECIRLLKKININVVSLANNHIGDLGIEGLRNTINVLKENNIAFFGAGENLEEASKPYVTTINEKTVCFMGFLMMDYTHFDIADVNTPGVCKYNRETLRESIHKYKELYDYVFVCPHWGKEHTALPQLSVLRKSKELIDYGADGVFSSHTHVVQPFFYYRGKLIMTSLGNFIFPDRYINKPRITVFPSETERNQTTVPITYGYPVVDKLTLKVVPAKSRIGCILTCCIDNNIHKGIIVHTQMNKDNYLELIKLSNLKQRYFDFLTWLIQRNLLYSVVLRIKNLLCR